MKILVIQNRMGIGDMIMFLPFIKAISNYYGEQVSLMVKKSTKASEYLNEEKYIKEIIYLERSEGEHLQPRPNLQWHSKRRLPQHRRWTAATK